MGEEEKRDGRKRERERESEWMQGDAESGGRRTERSRGREHRGIKEARRGLRLSGAGVK